MIINPYRYAASSTLLDGLVSWWSLDEASGTRVDSHGSNDLTDVNTVGSAAGKVGTAADMEAANNEQLNGSDTSLDFGATGGTLAVWINPETVASHPGCLIYDGGDPQSPTLGFYTHSNGTISCRMTNSAGAKQDANSAVGAISVGAWALIVCRYIPANSGAEINLTINGGATFTRAFTGAVRSGGNVILGSLLGTFDGLVDEAAWWSRPLTADEITELYNSGNGIGYPG